MAKLKSKKTVNSAPAKKAPAKAAVPAKKAPAKRGFPAKKAATAGKRAPARKRKPLPTFKAPADFKPHFLLVQARTEADGLFASNLKATRYQGRFDRDADEKKKFDLSTYDPATLIGIAARIGGVTYKATNDKKYPALPKERAGVKGAMRLPAKQVFQILIRVGKKSADGSLTAGIKQIWQSTPNLKTGKMKLTELEKTDPAYRLIRKASRFLPAAFANVQMPPKRTRGSRKQEEGDDE